MSTDNYGIIDDYALGQQLTPDQVNDVNKAIDNQLGELINFLGLTGVVSGWELTAEADLKVSAGEGWVGTAHCKTSVAQAVTGLTSNTTNYIFAQRKTAATGRVSTSFTTGAVDFVANTTGTPPANAILLATGVVSADGTHFESVNNSPATRPEAKVRVGKNLEVAGKIGFFDGDPVVKSAVADLGALAATASFGDVDARLADVRTKLNALLDALQSYGLV